MKKKTKAPELVSIDLRLPSPVLVMLESLSRHSAVPVEGVIAVIMAIEFLRLTGPDK